MESIFIAALAFAIMLGGAALGVTLRRKLPGHHLNDASKDIVRLGASLIATMSALVLGLLITSAKQSYEVQRNDIRQIAGKHVLLDSQLGRYGPEARHARELLRLSMVPLVDRIWGERAMNADGGAPFQPSHATALVFEAIENLVPQTDSQRLLKLQALQTTGSITELRIMLFEQIDSSMPLPLLGMLIFWLTILMASFTLFSPINRTSAVALLIIAFSAAGAIFLIEEITSPFSGVIQISRESLQGALGTLPP